MSVMTKKETDTTMVAFRLAAEQIRQFSLLAYVYGGKSRALTVAIDRLYQQTMNENAAFRELVAEGNASPTAPDDDAAGEG